MNGPPRFHGQHGPSAAPETTPQVRSAAEGLQALARAARSIVLYDAGNAMVRHHLADYQSKMCGALQAHGAMAIAVAPFQLAVAGHIVYEERDREKSLAFHLYRDGVRAVRVLARTTWEELLELLQIVAIRYSAVRDQEEDTVTLLRRAEFKGIEVDVVEGFTPAEEVPEPEGELLLERGRRARPPAGWDTPMQKLPAPGPLEYRPVPDETLAPFREEADEDAVAGLALTLARDLVAEAARGGWPMPNRDLSAFFSEVRDGLLVDGKLEQMRELVDILATAGASDLRDLMLRGIGDTHTLDLVLESVPETSGRLPPHLLPFLPLLAVGTALDRLATPLPEGRRSLLVKVVLARLPREADVVLARLPAFEPAVVRELANGLVTRCPERAAELARALLAQRDDDLRVEALAVMEAAPATVPLRPLIALLEDRSEAVRVRAAEALGKRGDESAVEALGAALESSRPVSSGEAEAIGRSLAQLAPAKAAELFRSWLEVKPGILRRVTPEQRARQWAAVAGSGLLPDKDLEDALRVLAARAGGELRRHCVATLARRRKDGEHRG